MSKSKRHGHHWARQQLIYSEREKKPARLADTESLLADFKNKGGTVTVLPTKKARNIKPKKSIPVHFGTKDDGRYWMTAADRRKEAAAAAL